MHERSRHGPDGRADACNVSQMEDAEDPEVDVVELGAVRWPPSRAEKNLVVQVSRTGVLEELLAQVC